jgi:hypothetical protein
VKESIKNLVRFEILTANMKMAVFWGFDDGDSLSLPTRLHDATFQKIAIFKYCKDGITTA